MRKHPTQVRDVRIASLEPAQFSERSSRGEIVQFGAWRDQADAAHGWNKLAARGGDLLAGVLPHIVEADVPGKGHYWRLRADVPPGDSAVLFCAKFRSRGFACLAVRA